jgi:hypothetical protein
MPLQMNSTPQFQCVSFNHFKMADVQTSEVDEKISPASLGLSSVRFGNHSNHTVLFCRSHTFATMNLIVVSNI